VSETEMILLAVLGVGVGALLWGTIWFYRQAKMQTLALHETQEALQANQLSIAKTEHHAQTLEATLAHTKEALHDMQGAHERAVELLHQERLQNATLEAQMEAQKQSHQKLQEAFETQEKQLSLKLHAIMQEGLESKLKKFDESSLKSLDTLLKPFKENLDTFKRKVELSQENSIQKFAQLSKEIEYVAKAGLSITQEAQSLTKALKGKKQTQGSWGEMILESVLEYSGLLKGVHYDTQSSFRGEDGRQKRPDVIIKLPKKRSIIIDSKVSLVDYDAVIRAQDDEERALAAKDVVRAFRSHIDTLERKDYAHYDVGTLQYVFMFVPIEGAFALAVQEDLGLYEYALKKHIAIVTPSTLTVSLRTIYLYWQSEQSTSHAQKLFVEAGKLYDKMHGFAETFTRFGSQLQTLQGTYEQASKQLTEGQGNLLSRTEKLKTLGAKTTKSLRDAKVVYDTFDETEKEVVMIDSTHSE
jgi:DNA recombination protein RmuC